ncbi:hypothetical protein ACQ4PT_065708 [Festuca glaucescens]
MLPVGADAEVRSSDDPGFDGSFYEVTVTGHCGRGYTVVYSTLVAEDGGPLEEAAAAAHMAKLKDVVDDIEVHYNVTARPGMISEINTTNCVDPSMTPKDAGGSQHAVSQQGGGSTMDNRLSESLAIKHLPFVKTSPLWPHIETMGVLPKAPQLEALLCRKNMQHTEPHNDDAMMKTLEEKIAHKEAEDRELGARMRVLAMALHQLRLYASLVRDMMRSAVSQKISNATEISRLKHKQAS